MALPQQQPNTRGQCLDRHRTPPRYAVWPGNLQTGAFTLSVYAAGAYSFEINGVLVEYTAAGGDDEFTTTAGLLADFQSKSLALAAAFPTIAAAPAPQNVLSLTQRMSESQNFVISNVTAPGGATFAYADTSTVRTRLGLGLAVAFASDSPDEIRKMTTGDTGATIAGVTVEGYETAPNSGDPNDDDGYDPASSVAYANKGLVSVPVEVEVTDINSPVYARIIAPGDEELGAWRPDDDGASGNVVLVPNARWTDVSWLDDQARLTCEVRLNIV